MKKNGVKPFVIYDRNGFVFNDYTTDGLESAMGRAIALWYKHPEYFRQLRINGSGGNAASAG